MSNKTVWVRGQHKTSMSSKLHMLLDPKNDALLNAQPEWDGAPVPARKMTLAERRRATEVRVIKEIAQYVFKLERASKKKGRYSK